MDQRQQQPSWGPVVVLAGLAKHKPEYEPEFDDGVSQGTLSERDLVLQSISFGKFDLTGCPHSNPSSFQSEELDQPDLSHGMKFRQNEDEDVESFSGLITDLLELSQVEELTRGSGSPSKSTTHHRLESSDKPQLEITKDIDGRKPSPGLPWIFNTNSYFPNSELSALEPFLKRYPEFLPSVSKFGEGIPENELARTSEKPAVEQEPPVSASQSDLDAGKEFTGRNGDSSGNYFESPTSMSRSEAQKCKKGIVEPIFTLKSLDCKEFIPRAARNPVFEHALDFPEFVPQQPHTLNPPSDNNFLQQQYEDIHNWFPSFPFPEVPYYPDFVPNAHCPRPRPHFQHAHEYQEFIRTTPEIWNQNSTLSYYPYYNFIFPAIEEPFVYPENLPMVRNSSTDFKSHPRFETKAGNSFDMSKRPSESDVTPEASLHSMTFWNSKLADFAALEEILGYPKLEEMPMEVLFPVPSARVLPGSSCTSRTAASTSERLISSQIELAPVSVDLHSDTSAHPSVSSHLRSRVQSPETQARTWDHNFQCVDKSWTLPPPGLNAAVKNPYCFEDSKCSQSQQSSGYRTLPPPPPETDKCPFAAKFNDVTSAGLEMLTNMLKSQVADSESLMQNSDLKYKNKRMLEQSNQMLKHQLLAVEETLNLSVITENDIGRIENGQDQIHAMFHELNLFDPGNRSTTATTVQSKALNVDEASKCYECVDRTASKPGVCHG